MRISEQLSLVDGPARPTATVWEERLRAAGPPWARVQARRVALAAVRCGVGPEEIAERFDVVAETAGWADATRVQYVKALRSCGIALAARPTPEPAPGRRSWPRLWQVADGAPASTVRAAAWLRLAAGWPAPIGAWATLGAGAVEVDGDDVFVTTVGPPVRVLGAGAAWRGWLDVRARYRGVEQALVSLHADRFGAPAGTAMSPRGLQATFDTHVRTIAAGLATAAASSYDEQTARQLTVEAEQYETLTYDTFRRLMLAAGAQAPAPAARGMVRAGRGR